MEHPLQKTAEPSREGGSALVTLGRLLVLTLALALLNSLDFAGLRLSETAQHHPWSLLLVAFLHTAAVSAVVLRARSGGWGLGGAVFGVYYALSALLVGLEAVYLSDLLTPEVVRSLFVNGAVTAAGFAYLSVLVHGKLHRGEVGLPARPRPLAAWAARLLAAGAAYLVLFVAGGLLVFGPLVRALEPVAGPAYLAAFEPENPLLVLLFQFGRGALWALLTLPLLRFLGRGWFDALHVAALYALVMASQLLLPSDLLPGVRAAHAAEVFVGNAAFGLVVVGLLGQRRGGGSIKGGPA